jgi:predicted metalloprotease with PDZ domain
MIKLYGIGRSLLSLAVLGAFATVRLSAQGAPITVAVDATDAPRQILHSHITMAVAPGPLTLYYPKWIPGEQEPNGALTDLTGIELHADGAPLAWHRDPVDLYAFHVTLPATAKSLAIDLDFLSPGGVGVFNSARSTTTQLAIVSWNTVVLYPGGRRTDDLTVAASLRLPAGWKYATALPVARQTGDTVELKPVSLTTLVDAPVLLGAHMRTLALGAHGSSKSVHQIDMAAETSAALGAPPSLVGGCEKLVDEADALFGARHFGSYRWLLTLSDFIPHSGLEHHESSDNRMDEQSLLREGLRRDLAGLLVHEYVHSWNGKYRIPADLVSPDLQAPVKSDLLWVYEGLTQYLSFVLAPRSGLWPAEYTREHIAEIAATMDVRAGRTWRSLADTAVGAALLARAPNAWQAWRRGSDYYDESVLLWLEVDMILRQKSGGKASLDDFCRRFFSGGNGLPEVKTYTFEDVVATLQALAPFDWRGFFAARVEQPSSHAPLGGVTASGWKLVYDEEPNQWAQDRLRFTDWSYSLGILVQGDGSVRDVIPGSPAAKAGLVPGMRLLAIDGRGWSADWGEAVLREAKGGKEPIELLLELANSYRTYAVNYHDGPRYPHLERSSGQADLLTTIFAPRAAKK